MNNGRKELKKVLIFAVSTTWMHRIISAISGIVALPIVISGLGKTEYGIWVAICQTSTFLGLSDFGVGNAVGRLVARCRGLKDKKQLSEVYSTAAILLIFSAAFAAIFALGVSPWIGNILRLNNSYSTLATHVFLIVAVSQIVQFPMKLSMGALTGHQLYGPHTLGKIFTSLLHLGGVVMLLLLHKVTILALATVDAAAAIIGQFVLLIVAWQLTRPWNLSLRKFSKKSFTDITSIGSSALVTTVSNTSDRAGLSILLARMVNINAVGIYGVALTIVENIQPLISSLSTPFSTIASELQAQNLSEKLRRSANTVSCVTFASALGVIIFFYFFSIPILGLLLAKSTWVADDYFQARTALIIMGTGLAFGLPQIVSRSILQGTGKHWYASNSLMISSFFSITVSFILLKMGIGSISVAIGWGMVWFLQGVIFFPRVISRFIGQSIWEMIKKCYLPGIAVGITTYTAALFSTRLIQNQEIIFLILKLFFSGFVMINAIIIFCGFEKNVCLFIRKLINK